MLEGGGLGIRPFSQVVFRGNFTLDGSGVGDTADCRITFPLPHNVVWQLDNFFFETNGSEYTDGIFSLFYAPSTSAFGDSTELRFVTATTIDSFVTATLSVNNIVLSGLLSAADSSYDQQSPFRVVSFQDESGGADPALHISGGAGTNINAGNIARLAVVFLGYTYEQMNSGLLFAGLSERG